MIFLCFQYWNCYQPTFNAFGHAHNKKKLVLQSAKGRINFVQYTVFKIGNQTEIKSLQKLEANFHTLNMSTFKYSKQFWIWTKIFWKKSNFRILSLSNYIKSHVFLFFDPFAPTCANFHLVGVIKHAERNFLAYSKCVWQGVVKSSYFGLPAGIWTLDFHDRAKKEEKRPKC